MCKAHAAFEDGSMPARLASVAVPFVSKRRQGEFEGSRKVKRLGVLPLLVSLHGKWSNDCKRRKHRNETHLERKANVMKYKQGWALAFAAIVAACSSTPSRVTVIEARDRAEYVKVADSRLSHWEKEASAKAPEDKRQMMALIRDARAEVRHLETAPGTDWEIYRSRVQSRFERINELDNKGAE